MQKYVRILAFYYSKNIFKFTIIRVILFNSVNNINFKVFDTLYFVRKRLNKTLQKGFASCFVICDRIYEEFKKFIENGVGNKLKITMKPESLFLN